ncbi:MAG: universal stress protein [Candidatus Dormibacter sp.]
MSLVEIPARWTGLVSSAVVRSRELLRSIAASDYEGDNTSGGRLGVQSRFTADPTASIHEALLETQCDVVLMEWPAIGARRQHRLASILKSLLTDPQINLIVARPDLAAKGGRIRPRSVIAPLRGGPNAFLALSVAVALACDAGAELTLLHVYDSTRHPKHLRHEEATFHELVRAAEYAHPIVIERVAQGPAEAVLGLARDYDAVVMGAHSNPRETGALVGPLMSVAMSQLPGTVILARAARGQVQAV